MGILLGTALGDAFGAGYEFRFKTREEFQAVDLSQYHEHPHPDFHQAAGMYTDDTQMSLAVAELMLGNDQFLRENLADYFVRAFKRDPINGYSRVLQEILEEVNSGEELLSRLVPHSTKNGTAMRSAILGYIEEPFSAAVDANINASVTHATPEGSASAMAVAIMSHYRRHGNEIDIEGVNYFVNQALPKASEYLQEVNELTEYDPELVVGVWAPEWVNKGVPSDAIPTVGAVLYILNNYNDVEDILRESVKLGGDTDSICSIALGIRGVEKEEIPQHLYEGLTNHAYGRTYLEELDRCLEDKFLRKQ